MSALRTSWDEQHYQGWRELGEWSMRTRRQSNEPVTQSFAHPTFAGQCTAVLNKAGDEMDMGMSIRELVDDGDTVIVKHSLERALLALIFAMFMPSHHLRRQITCGRPAQRTPRTSEPEVRSLCNVLLYRVAGSPAHVRHLPAD